MTSSYPDSRVGGPGYPFAPQEIFFAKGSTPGYNWSDITPRVGVAYDLFGNGKTAVKFNIGKYMEAITASNSDWDLNPLIRTTIQTTRGWDDTNRDYVVNCDLGNSAANGECRAMDSETLGQPVFTRTFDSNWISGWGARPYNWGLGFSVQQELMPRVSLTVGFVRNWWGNQYVVDNLASAVADYTPFSIAAPLDPRLPNGGGYTIDGLYDLVPEKVGDVDEFATSYRNYGDLTENWQGVNTNIVARFRNGLTVQAGTNTGRRLADGCDVRSRLPEYGRGVTGSTNSSVTAEVDALGGGAAALGVVNPYCRLQEPYRTDFRGLATYTIPRADVQISGTWISTPGDSMRADFRANSAWINAGPQPLGRPLSGSSLVTVNLIEPFTVWEERRNTIDMRIAKILRFGRTRTQVGVDIYNLANADTITSQDQVFRPGGTWLTPRTLVASRYARISAQVDF
jgi:hypothetical protein